MENISGAILAGGKNKRMGGVNKSFIEIQGSPIIQGTVNILKEMFEEIIIVTNSPADFESYRKECHIVSDIIKDVGPLGGIHSALSHTTKEGVFFVACDMPYLHKGLIRRLLEEARKDTKSCVVPYSERGLEPLHAVYSKASLENIKLCLDKKEFSIREFLKHCNCKYIKAQNDEMSSFHNINMQTDLKEIVHD